LELHAGVLRILLSARSLRSSQRHSSQVEFGLTSDDDVGQIDTFANFDPCVESAMSAAWRSAMYTKDRCNAPCTYTRIPYIYQTVAPIYHVGVVMHRSVCKLRAMSVRGWQGAVPDELFRFAN
jgi:hypothetical protein